MRECGGPIPSPLSFILPHPFPIPYNNILSRLRSGIPLLFI